MAKTTNKKLDEAMAEVRKVTGLTNLMLHTDPERYGIRMLGAPAGPGMHHAPWLSPEFKTRDEMLTWMHGFLQGWVLCSER